MHQGAFADPPGLPCAGMCRLDIVLVSETIKQHDLWAYPYNALRNQALSRAETDVSAPNTDTDA